MQWFGSQSQKTLPDAIERACASICENGLLHSHQWRPFHIWPEAPKKATELLKPLASRIAASRNFDDDLYPIICTTLARCKGTGLLASYDIACRIGAWMRSKLEPIQVFLHRGTREGAKAVGVRVNRERAPMSDFREDLRQSLTAAQMEDMLCIYRGTLARIARNGQVERTSPRGIPRCVIVPAHPRAPRPGAAASQVAPQAGSASV